MDKGIETLIKKARKGNKVAIQKLYAQFEQKWFCLCLRYAHNKSEAEDIFQEGVAKIFQNLDKFKVEKGSFQSWTNKVIINAALKYLKKYQWQQSFTDLDLTEDKVAWSDDILGEITAKELINVIQQLPSGYRVVFNMREIEGYAHKEIAEALNISVGTSKSQLSKAKKVLQQKIKVLFLK